MADDIARWYACDGPGEKCRTEQEALFEYLLSLGPEEPLINAILGAAPVTVWEFQGGEVVGNRDFSEEKLLEMFVDDLWK